MEIKKIFIDVLQKIIYKFSTQNEKQSIYTKDLLVNKNFDIGEYSYGKPQVFFENDAKLVIGKFCSIAKDVTIFLGGNHRTDWISTYPFNVLFNEHPVASKIHGHPATKGDVIIGNDVWIGHGATIMSGVTIDDGAIIGAYSVITKNIGSYEIWAGNPARLIRKRFSEKKISELLNLEWWNWDIEKILNNSDWLCSNFNF